MKPSILVIYIIALFGQFATAATLISHTSGGGSGAAYMVNQVALSAVPEPYAFLLSLLGLLMLLRRRRC